MTYAMLPDELPDRMEESGLCRDDRYLYVEMHVYCARLLTDGRIVGRLSKITDHPDPDAGVERLIAAGYVQRQDTGLLLPDFLKTNHDRTTVEAMREKSRKTSERHRRHLKGDHSLCDPSRCSGLRDVTNDVTESVSDGVLSDSIRSDQQIGEERIGEGFASGAQERASATPSPQRVTGPHVGVDADATGTCVLCDQPIKAKGHQNAQVPKDLASFASLAYAAGLTAESAVRDEAEEAWRITAESSQGIVELLSVDDVTPDLHLELVDPESWPLASVNFPSEIREITSQGIGTYRASQVTNNHMALLLRALAACAPERQHDYVPGCCGDPEVSPVHTPPKQFMAIEEATGSLLRDATINGDSLEVSLMDTNDRGTQLVPVAQITSSSAETAATLTVPVDVPYKRQGQIADRIRHDFPCSSADEGSNPRKRDGAGPRWAITFRDVPMTEVGNVIESLPESVAELLQYMDEEEQEALRAVETSPDDTSALQAALANLRESA